MSKSWKGLIQVLNCDIKHRIGQISCKIGFVPLELQIEIKTYYLGL